jgi:hypothetical protein
LVADEFATIIPIPIGYINLLPNYATPAQWNTKTYNDYVANFAGGSSGVRPLVLSYDYYPDFMINPVANKAGYEANAASFLAASRNNGNSLASITKQTKDLCDLLL